MDPTLGELLVSWGYDRTFASLVSSGDPAAAPVPVRPQAWREVVVDGSTVTVPPGVVLDLGATGKTIAADLVAGAVVSELSVPVVVSVGGDVRADAPSGHHVAWPVVVDHTRDDVDAGTGCAQVVQLVTGGLATSSVAARRWVRGGRTWHHVVDPRTGAPARGPWRSVSAGGHTCVAANVASTAAIVLGERAVAWLSQHGVSARLVGHDGLVVTTGDWPRVPAGGRPGARAR